MRRSITGRTHLARINDLVETGEVVPRLSRGRRQGAITGQLDTPGDIAEGNKPVSFTRHRLILPYVSGKKSAAGTGRE